MVHNIHHISGFTKSAKESIYFYTEILGLRLVKNTVNQENTKMRHLFFGDYQGTPGTLLTFFEISKLGQRRDFNNYFSTNYLAIPKGSLQFWKERLLQFNVESHQDDEGLEFTDFDDFKLKLIETDEQIQSEKATQHSTVPAHYQIIRIAGTSLVVENPTLTNQFLHTYLGIKSTETLPLNNRTSFTIVKKSSELAKSRIGRGSIDHIAYSAATAADLEELYQTALANQFKIEEYVDRGYFKSLYVKEPNGLRIEIATELPGFLIDEDLATLGENLALPAFLETKRTTITKTLEEL
ncbi:glyoxalase/bleomycin resistance/extradiol dioxygenase family protein [Carnobacterium maltaromaticum]|jgi:catechol 2,3-dioxygenase-like lactoylglutathione lyase family enzyme|uniref:Glyoxalase/Bleomycin resistance /Dioxygenase superfamily protein n=1 Tax=Carnobacterium maltaromaticum LMA28 TaxID=1234679 RepID=K8E2F3_CARML|nr:glyoxalase/bleomycin resistance/extradiol dioxygenase family protein [Carnobacterium maltaromaticum]AOA01212.1 ring-cleaving dioxygenase [Carnobacterium maltaromaticum]KRN63007.1 ring-cleaving dioxygenase MhqA [Carnobacterium maltaromaticum DSM 20342]MCC4313020.1 ring-cleaving dioxygenase [Carnobacterium maltaromaticum]MCI1818336.1 glyoxalase/bleomycin resistance/extradiol dioxygenase family protein [Carnobacterium maltaromaticum]CCO10222.2 glyoxalase/Bleomycin resistance /Dioxygenase super